MERAVTNIAEPIRVRRSALFAALRVAIVAMLAAMGSLVCTWAIVPGAGPAVLAVVLSLSLSRSEPDRDRRRRIEAAALLPVVGFSAFGVAWLLHHLPWLGAATFVAGMFVSIWLRRFGTAAGRAGSLVALPFVTLLVTPPLTAPATNALPAALVPVAIALIAVCWVVALHALARRAGFLPHTHSHPPRRETKREPRESGLQPDAATRMAIQMAAALALSFFVGFAFFGQRWAWIVLTSFIVISGNRGRLEVAYKSVLRVCGAAAGTAFALVASTHVDGNGGATVALILLAVFFGVWLRPLGYAWWALFATIALALLQGFSDQPAPRLLLLRLEEIVIGAAIGVAAAWWILPVRSTGVLRRRLADALAALAGALDPALEARGPDAFVAALSGVEQLAPSFRASRFAMRRLRAVQPADWIDAIVACREPAVALIASGATPTDVRRAVGSARKALLDPAALLSALQALRSTLSANGHARPLDGDGRHARSRSSASGAPAADQRAGPGRNP